MKLGDTLKCKSNGINNTKHPLFNYNKVTYKDDVFIISKIEDKSIISTCGRVVHRWEDLFELIKTNINNYEIY
jgi:hypothetical protein